MQNILKMIYKIKNITLAFLASCALFLTGCDQTFKDDKYDIGATAQPAFVRFTNPNSSNNIYTRSEGDKVVLAVYASYGVAEDIVVTYTFSGSAVYGTDFVVEGASASGGSLTIPYNVGVASRGGAEFEVDLLRDNTTDGDKELVIRLVSATTASGKQLGVGQGPAFVESKITIKDTDCPSNMAGNFLMTNDFCEPAPIGATITRVPGTNNQYIISDMSGNFINACTPNEGFFIEFTLTESCGSIRPSKQTVFGVEFEVISGTWNERTGVLTLRWTDALFGLPPRVSTFTRR
jgi:hypothetical protein